MKYEWFMNSLPYKHMLHINKYKLYKLRFSHQSGPKFNAVSAISNFNSNYKTN